MFTTIFYETYISDATRGWAGWAKAHPEFGSSINPITTRAADYAHHITASPPGFEIPAASLNMMGQDDLYYTPHLLSYSVHRTESAARTTILAPHKDYYIVRDAAGISNAGGLAIMWWALSAPLIVIGLIELSNFG